jgi:preprotein translocase SecF subunit
LAVVERGRGILDIDFVGGVSVEAVFKDSQQIENIRAKLSNLNDLSVQSVRTNPLDMAKLSNLNDLSGQGVRTNPLDAERKDKTLENTHFILTTSIPQDKEKDIQPEEYLRQVRDEIKAAFKDALVYRHLDYSYEESTDATKTIVSLKLEPGMNHESLLSAVGASMQSSVATGILPNDFTYKFSGENFYEGSRQIFTDWTMTAEAPRETVEKLLQPMKANIDDTPQFPTSTTVGGSVAKDTRTAGLIAILGSLVCIVLYIWLRFQKIVYGIASVIGLVHVVLVVLGLIALSKWLVGPLAFMQVEEFKIGLPVVAAFLTIIGYALNDTIILFDRIRENRGKNPRLTDKMINDATNQTLSRTVLTAGTTAVVSVVLYFWGGQGIHTFAFAMSAGVIFGTYGTIGICAPLLLWMAGEVVTKKDDEP